MPGKKIQQLGDGGSLQSFDRIPIARNNTNRYINGSSFATPSDIGNLQNQINNLSYLTTIPSLISPLTSLPLNHILVGNASNLPSKVPVGGDISLSYNPTNALLDIKPNVVTYNKIQKITTGYRLLGSTTNNSDVQEVQVQTNMIEDGAVQFSKIQKSTQANVVLGATAAGVTFSEQKVSNAMLEQVSSQTMKGRSSSGIGPVEDLTPAQIRTMLNVSSGAAPNSPTNLSIIQTDPSLVHINSSTQDGTNTGIDVLSATALRAGVMTAADRIKLNGIATGATNNTGTVESIEGDLPVKVIAGSSGIITKTPKITIDAATPTSAGLLTGSDKAKLDGIGNNANNYSHPNHSGVITSNGDGQTFWNETLPATKGGTGYTSYGDGEILIGDSSAAGGTTLKKANITKNYGIDIQNGPASIKVGLDFSMVGMIAPFYRNGAAPTGWLLCDGSPIPAGTQYDELRVQIGSNTPNLQGMTLMGAGPNPDPSLTYNYIQGSTGGQAKVKLTTAEMPTHKHAITDPGHGHTCTVTDPGHDHGFVRGSTYDDGGETDDGPDTNDDASLGSRTTLDKTNITVSVNSHTTGITATNNEGLSDYHENRPPYFVVKWYIKY